MGIKERPALFSLAPKKAASMKALKHLFNNMPFEGTIELSDGLEGVVKPFFRPRPNQRGIPHAGIDVELFQDGEPDGHLEFLLTLSGWESDEYCLGLPDFTFGDPGW